MTVHRNSLTLFIAFLPVDLLPVVTHAQHPAVLEAVRYFVTTVIWSIALLVLVLVLHDRQTKAQRASEARLTNRQDGFQERLSNIEREFQSQNIERPKLQSQVDEASPRASNITSMDSAGSLPHQQITTPAGSSPSNKDDNEPCNPSYPATSPDSSSRTISPRLPTPAVMRVLLDQEIHGLRFQGSNQNQWSTVNMAEKVYKSLVQLSETSEDNEDIIISTIQRAIDECRRGDGHVGDAQSEEEYIAVKSAQCHDQGSKSKGKQPVRPKVHLEDAPVPKRSILQRNHGKLNPEKQRVRIEEPPKIDHDSMESTPCREEGSKSKGKQPDHSNYTLRRHDSVHGRSGYRPRGKPFDVPTLDVPTLGEWNTLVRQLDVRKNDAARGDRFGPFCRPAFCVCKGQICRRLPDGS